MRKNWKLAAVMLLWGFLSLTGFRTFHATTRWTTTVASPKIFVKFCAEPSVTRNDLPVGDPLYGQALNFSLIMNSIYNDFNSIESAYVQLVSDADSEFAGSVGRTISICVSNVAGAGSGFATPRYGGDGKITGCEITLSPATTDEASTFVATVTHEIGHCLGLDHAHETDQAIMSYFYDRNKPRLQMDDKMGIIQQFPTEAGFGREAASFGMACAPRG